MKRLREGTPIAEGWRLEGPEGLIASTRSVPLMHAFTVVALAVIGAWAAVAALVFIIPGILFVSQFY